MHFAYKATMSILNDPLKQSIRPVLLLDHKYGLILWIYVIHEVQTASFQCIKTLDTLKKET